jgi:hypothetical protein
MLYPASDGYADQDGGEREKKIKTKNFKHLLTGMQLLSMQHQKKHLEDFAETWRGEENNWMTSSLSESGCESFLVY